MDFSDISTTDDGEILFVEVDSKLEFYRRMNKDEAMDAMSKYIINDSVDNNVSSPTP